MSGATIVSFLEKWFQEVRTVTTVELELIKLMLCPCTRKQEGAAHKLCCGLSF